LGFSYSWEYGGAGEVDTGATVALGIGSVDALVQSGPMIFDFRFRWRRDWFEGNDFAGRAASEGFEIVAEADV